MKVGEPSTEYKPHERQDVARGPSELPAEAGRLPDDAQRFGMCRNAFEEGMYHLLKDPEMCTSMSEAPLSKLSTFWWPAMAPLTAYERTAVAWRVREVAKTAIASGQIPKSVAD